MNAKKTIKELDKKFFNGKISDFIKKNLKSDKLAGVSIDISGNCNLNCDACCFREKYGAKGIMSLETFSKLKGSFAKISSIELQCNAEPLLNTNIGEIIKSIKKENPNIYISLVTNGTLLTEKNAAILLESGIDKFSVSIDSSEKELFETLRKGANFEIVLNNTKNAINLRNKTNSQCKIGIVTVSSQSNLHQLNDLLALIKKLGADTWTINGLEAYDQEMEKIVLYGNKTNSETAGIFENLKKEALKNEITLLMPSLKITPYENCILNSCLIHWNGDVSPCAGLSYEREIYSFGFKMTRPKIIFGNINNQNIFDIWNNPEYKNFRNNLKTGKFPAYCKNCLIKSKVICPVTE